VSPADVRPDARAPSVPEPKAPARVSFILPARNEERHVGNAIASIKQFCPPDLLAEIIVVDHGSTDATRAIAASAGAIVLTPRVSTIGSLRNEGAKIATGNVFVFLDADVTLTEAWAADARDAINQLLAQPALISGSNCDAPESSNWFLKYWFSEISRDHSANSIGSAHMLVTRSLFESLGGFDPRLRTGEDPDLCERAKQIGGATEARPSLRVVHHGYPLTVRAFVRRERWHGGGDTTSLMRALSSRIVWMTAAFILLHVAFFVGLVVSLPLAAAAFGLLLAHLYVSARVRFTHLQRIPFTRVLPILYLYYFGRTLSFIHVRERGER